MGEQRAAEFKVQRELNTATHKEIFLVLEKKDLT